MTPTVLAAAGIFTSGTDLAFATIGFLAALALVIGTVSAIRTRSSVTSYSSARSSSLPTQSRTVSGAISPSKLQPNAVMTIADSTGMPRALKKSSWRRCSISVSSLFLLVLWIENVFDVLICIPPVMCSGVCTARS